MSHELDISFLDEPEIVKKIFPMAFSITLTDSAQSASLNTDSYFIEVDDEVRICCRFYIEDKGYPSILYFHDNTETVLDQNTLASCCLEKGINLFVTDYRGHPVGLRMNPSELANSFNTVLRSRMDVLLRPPQYWPLLPLPVKATTFKYQLIPASIEVSKINYRIF